MRFRRDINALRGVAVGLVMLFHFQVPFLGGGFVGVDVFFVISGYLMTSIIVARLDAGRFSVLDFYLARFTRIVPALAVLSAAWVVLGWFYLYPAAYKLLAEHAGASLTFISNFVYWRESGYFDASSQSKWMLHTWSLSVEWQFYLLYPLVLMFGTRVFGRSRAVMQTVVWALGLASFVLALVVVRRHPEANFFLLPTRAWEMVAGGLVLLYGDRFRFSASAAARLQGAGLSAILLSGIALGESLDWPGPMTLVPVLGAVLVIAANAGDTPFSRAAPMQALGRWSYSVYLWHWPFVVLIRYLDLPAHQPAVVAAGLVLSVLFGLLSYALVEQRAAAMRQRYGWQGLGILVSAPVVMIASCTAITVANGVAVRLPEQIRQVSAESRNVDPRRTECLTQSVNRLAADGGDIGCQYGTSPRIGAIVWGDSHGNAVITGIAAAAQEHDASVMFYGTSGCPPLVGASRFGKHVEGPCRDFARRVDTALGQYPASIPLVMVARFSAYVDGKNDVADPTILIGYDGQRPLADPAARRARYASFLVNDLCALARIRKVYVLLPIPEMNEDVPNYLAKSLILGRRAEDVSVSIDSYARRNAVARTAIGQAAARCGVHMLDPVPRLCRDGRCFGSDALVPLYIDGDHLSRRGSERLRPLFRPVFEAS
ncbi:O-acetyltransferase OatA [Pandoraea terrae]|uniref:O-acetyltransferase OatA n=1 Tax=Pandoraea terrae TaxID=1537710 RepID=A0A5E4UVL3_9BURK|nr:acyltransferase family protein [Pandoraea terrae]VVE02520.1 O-acetyltransferase OatA [Pandoraea terrae]